MDEEPIIKGDEAPAAPIEEPAPPVEQAPPMEPAPAEAPTDAPAPVKSGGGKGMIIAIAVVAVVAIVVIAFVFMGSGGIEGKWELESAKVYDSPGVLNETISDAFSDDLNDPWMEFKSDGTVALGDADGTEDGTGTWETDSNKLTITVTAEVEVEIYNSTTGNTTWDNTTETSTIEYKYSVSGDTLTLEWSMEGKIVEMTAKRV